VRADGGDVTELATGPAVGRGCGIGRLDRSRERGIPVGTKEDGGEVCKG